MTLTPFQSENAALSLASFVKACRLCGGRLMDPRLDEHALCAARARRGASTPSLGDPCTQCGGVGCLPRSKVGPVNPSQRAIEAWAPTCDRCHGTRAEPGTVQDRPVRVTVQQECPICGSRPHAVNRYYHRGGPWTCAGHCADTYSGKDGRADEGDVR